LHGFSQNIRRETGFSQELSQIGEAPTGVGSQNLAKQSLRLAKIAKS